MTEDWQRDVEQCLSQIKLKDRVAFAQLYALSNKKLFGMVLRIVPDRDQAADVLQESFTRIWLNASCYRSDLGSAWGWLCQLTRNCALDSIRYSRRRPLTLLEPNDLDSQYCDASFDQNSRYDLYHCLSTIDADKRNAIIHIYLHGLTQSEFATRIKRPVNTIKTWIRRGLLELQQCLD